MLRGVCVCEERVAVVRVVAVIIRLGSPVVHYWFSLRLSTVSVTIRSYTMTNSNTTNHKTKVKRQNTQHTHSSQVVTCTAVYRLGLDYGTYTHSSSMFTIYDPTACDETQDSCRPVNA
jgi:hypothetical protein